MRTSASMLDSQTVRIILMIFAAVLLNFGLFFILAFFAPLVAGLVVGYFLENSKIGTLAGFTGAIVSYTTILLITEYLTGFGTDPMTLVSAILLMALIGALGGLLGGVIRSKSK
ncbi:MAG: hypothetical protein ACFFEE_07800 [Candidatus Thorarchaeota archaeon]